MASESEMKTSESQNKESQTKGRKTRFSVKSKTYKKLSEKVKYVPWIFNPMLKFDTPSHGDEVGKF